VIDESLAAFERGPRYRSATPCTDEKPIVTVSIVIPVYNEANTLTTLLDRVLSAPLPPGCVREIIVVDDGSTDDTPTILEYFAARNRILYHRLPFNAGKGTAIRKALDLVGGEVVLIQDGDLEYDPNDYVSILNPLLSASTDVVYGSRFCGGATTMSMRSLLANRALTFAANTLYRAKITDEATGYKAFKTEILRRVVLQCRRFEFCAEVTAKLLRLGHNVKEVPISYHPRSIAEGKKIRARDGVQALWTLLKYRVVSRASFLSISRTPSRIADAVDDFVAVGALGDNLFQHRGAASPQRVPSKRVAAY